MYLVKEMFGPTLQGEGAHAGRPCVFLRFAACNLECTWCDTDFAAEGAVKLDGRARSSRGCSSSTCTARAWSSSPAASRRCSGTQRSPTRFARRAFACTWSRNGTRVLGRTGRLADGVAEAAVPHRLAHARRRSPVERAQGRRRRHRRCTRPRRATRRAIASEHYFAQPCMTADYATSLARTISLVQERPRWRLSLQLHKILEIP